MQPELTANWVHTDTMGYGRMGERLVTALGKIGVDVIDGQEGRATNAVTWFSVPSHARHWFEGQRPSILTMWETMRLAEGMLEGLDNFDVIMVPSRQNVELFGEYHPNVKLVLLGVDDTWTYRKRVEPAQFFNFLCAGSGPRKGTEMTVNAFNKVFGNFKGSGPLPRLIMKNPRGESFCNGDRIEMISGRISGDEELELYASAHCYVQPSRGEGFGLQPLQAIAQGCPTILTAAHGHEAFAHLGYGLSSTPTEADYFSFGYAGQWWEPDFDELCDHMKWVYDNYDEAEAFAATSSEEARSTFTWENSARMLVDAIGLDVLTTPYTGTGEKVAATLRRFRVIVNQPWKADIAGKSFLFEPGRVYYETADVLRILFDAGLLDPACLVANPGLTENQKARIETYSASHAHCPSCNQRLNTQPTKADDLMAAREIERVA